MLDIRTGRYKVGTTLPPEIELCEIYGVSRNTMREALKQLVAAGMLSRNKRAGTFIESAEPLNRYVSAVSSLSDLFSDAHKTYLRVLEKKLVKVDPEAAKLVQGPIGSTWLRVHAMRFLPDMELPMSVSWIYVHEDYSGLTKYFRINGKSMWMTLLIEKHFNVTPARVEQEVSAVLLSSEVAGAMSVPTDSAGLRVVRRYFAADGKMILSACNLHPSTGIVLKTAWKLQEGQTYQT